MWSFLVHLTPFQKQKSKRRLKHVSSTEVAQSFCQDERDHLRLIKKYIIIEIGRGFVVFFLLFCKLWVNLSGCDISNKNHVAKIDKNHGAFSHYNRHIHIFFKL